MKSVSIFNLGVSRYLSVLRLQEELYRRNIAAKLSGSKTNNFLILCEHEPVFTLGKSGNRSNILVSDEEMNAEFYSVNRGGDVTFHGPGQLVIYPVLDLDSFGLGLAQYIHLIEEAIIVSLKDYGLYGERIPDAPGIWLRNKYDSKIGAIGVKASRNVTMHGAAVNIHTDLSYFTKIRACGLTGKQTTSLQKELNRLVSLAEYKAKFLTAFKEVFNVNLNTVKETEILR